MNRSFAKRVKTNNSQWLVLIKFMEIHPQLLKTYPVRASEKARQAQLWSELCKKLNSMGHGSKSALNWQLTFKKWKSKVKVKAQDISEGIKRAPLTEIELRLMKLLGWSMNIEEKSEQPVSNEAGPSFDSMSIPPPPLVYFKNPDDNLADSIKLDEVFIKLEPTYDDDEDYFENGSDSYDRFTKTMDSDENFEEEGLGTTSKEDNDLQLEILNDIKVNLASIAESQRKQCDLFGQFLELYRNKNN